MLVPVTLIQVLHFRLTCSIWSDNNIIRLNLVKMFWNEKIGGFFENKASPKWIYSVEKCQIPLFPYLLHPHLSSKAKFFFQETPKLHFKMVLNASRSFTGTEMPQMYLQYATVAKLDKCAFPAVCLPAPYHPLLLYKAGRDVLL